MNDDHITKMLENDAENSSRDFTLGVIRIVAAVVVLFLVLGFVILDCWMFATSNSALVEDVLTGILGFAAGIGVGVVAPKAVASLEFGRSD